MSKIIIRHNESDRILHSIEGDSLWEADLSGLNLAGAAMYAIELTGEKRRRHVFRVSSSVVNLSGANLSNADLSGAVFSETTLVGTSFAGANLSDAVLVRSNLIRADFTGANMANARLLNTCFSNCLNLHKALNLDKIEHAGPTALDSRTLRSNITKLPRSFLRGAGYSDNEIKALLALYRDQKTFFSCFISYARSDFEFADYIRRHLLKNDISCWQDVHDMRGGAQWRGQIYDAIEKQDKLVLICSRESLARPAVVEEIQEAIERERQIGAQKLFPIRLDDYILSDELEKIARQNVKDGKWKENWVTYVRSFHIPDFSSWKKPKAFRTEFNRFVEALQAPPTRRGR